MKPALIGASIALFVTAAAAQAQTGTGATGVRATPAQRQGAPASAGSASTGSSQSSNTTTSTAPVVRDANRRLAQVRSITRLADPIPACLRAKRPVCFTDRRTQRRLPA